MHQNISKQPWSLPICISPYLTRKCGCIHTQRLRSTCLKLERLPPWLTLIPKFSPPANQQVTNQRIPSIPRNGKTSATHLPSMARLRHVKGETPWKHLGRSPLLFRPSRLVHGDHSYSPLIIGPIVSSDNAKFI